MASVDLSHVEVDDLESYLGSFSVAGTSKIIAVESSTSDYRCRIQFYRSAEDRTTDEDRDILVEPTVDVVDWIGIASDLTLSPDSYDFTFDPTGDIDNVDRIYWRVTNMSGIAIALEVTVNYGVLDDVEVDPPPVVTDPPPVVGVTSGLSSNIPGWQILVANSSDLEIIADITYEAKNKQIQLGLNQAGVFNCSSNTNSFYTDYFYPLKYCIIAKRNGRIVWSGPIWNVQQSFDSEQISIGAVGWLEILFHRYHVDNTQLWTLENAGNIVFDMLENMNAQRDTWISEGINTNSQLRTVTAEPYSNYGDHIKGLTEVENGIDIEVDPETRELNVFAADDFSVTDVYFDFNTGRQNAANFSRTIDAAQMANQYYVRGHIATAEAHDTGSYTEFDQLMQQIINLTEVNDVTLLGAIANAELAVNSYPRVLFSFTPLVEQLGSKFFTDYNIRDQIFVSAERGNLTPIESQPARVFGASINIDEAGNEIVTNIDVTYQSG